MKNPLKSLLFSDKPLAVRIWMWTAILALLYYLTAALVKGRYLQDVRDIYVMAYGLFSVAVYLLVFAFDWK
jgi:hypothetical protein